MKVNPSLLQKGLEPFSHFAPVDRGYFLRTSKVHGL